jgi:hypothetical protein
MDRRFAYTLDYPRAAHAAGSDCVGPIGYAEMELLTGRAMTAIYKWLEMRKLPYADGPLVHGRPTWQRSTFLAWAYRSGFTLDETRAPLACHHEAEMWSGVTSDEAVQRVCVAERPPVPEPTKVE